jgi:hypothetical protein
MFTHPDSLPPTAQIKERLNEAITTINHLKENGGPAHDAKVNVLFETTREVLKDLVAAYDLYERDRPGGLKSLT